MRHGHNIHFMYHFLLVRNCSLRWDFLTNIKYEGFGEDKCIVIFSLAEDGHNGVMLVWSATDGNICIRPVQDFTLTHAGGDSWI